jgi:hypothetical protein
MTVKEEVGGSVKISHFMPSGSRAHDGTEFKAEWDVYFLDIAAWLPGVPPA